MSTHARAPRGVALAALTLLITLTLAPAAGAAPRGLAESAGWWAALWSWLAPAGLWGWAKEGPIYDPNGDPVKEGTIWDPAGEPWAPPSGLLGSRPGREEAAGGQHGHTKEGPDYDPDGHRLASPSSPLLGRYSLVGAGW